MNEKQLRQHARLLLEVGVGLQKGQCLHVTSEPVHWAYLSLLVEEAYRAGARYVDVEATHPSTVRGRVTHSSEEFLDFVPEGRKKTHEMMVRDRWARLVVSGSFDPDYLSTLDPAKNARMRQAAMIAARPLHDACVTGVVPWCVTALPTPKWGGQVLGREADADARDAFWDVLAPIYRLDREDPVAAWWEHAEALDSRATHLTDRQFEKLRIRSSRTDLTVTLSPRSVWLGGSIAKDGTGRFVPNLPTEEVFTTPDYRGVEGRVGVTRPVDVMGRRVTGAWFEFREGTVTDFGAESGRETLESFFSIDERARRMGEIALVDGSNPVGRAGLVFHSILLDENASCHFALGNGYPTGMRDTAGLSEKELVAIGCNQSLQHVDFMFGDDELEVTGGRGGEEVRILERGRFTEAFAAGTKAGAAGGST